MADDSGKISFLLDLDVTQFTEKGLEAQGVIKELGNAENLSGLIHGITSAAPLLATAGVAAYAFKEAIDLTLEGEQINRVNQQFETLSEQAGIAPSVLKRGLEEAAKGLADTDDLLKVANEAIVKMGASAKQLPQIMEIARKSTQVYGGDTVSNFENISSAIANGNTRLLKHYGIIVDNIKAEKDFAAANGTTVDQLSEAGKKQAILNAALEAGQQAFKNINTDTQSATTILQSLKVTFKEIGDIFTLAFEKTIGPGIRSFLSGVQSMASHLKLTLQSNIGDGAEAAAAKLTLTQEKVADIEATLAKLKKTAGTALDFAPGDTQAKIQSLTGELKKYQTQLTQLEIENQKIEQEEAANDAKGIARLKNKSSMSIIDQQKALQNQQNFRKEMSKIDQQYFAMEQKNVQSIDQIDQLIKKKAVISEQQHQLAIQQIRANAGLTYSQKKQLIAAEDQRYQLQMRIDEEQTSQYRKQLLDDYSKHSTSVYNGIARTFEANTKKMQLEQADFGKRGNEMWNSLSSNATSAFTNMGAQMAQGKDIASATADAMKGFFLGFLGDRASAEGSVMLLSGIWPPNPVALAGGAALLALGGALKSAAGAGAAPSTAISSPSIQAQASGTAPPLVPVGDSSSDQSTAVPNMAGQQVSQRTVSVNIAGNYLETDQTKQLLMNLMRQESDATGFNYNQIGA